MHYVRSPISTELGLLFEQEREYVEDKPYLGLSSCGLMSVSDQGPIDAHSDPSPPHTTLALSKKVSILGITSIASSTRGYACLRSRPR